MKELVKLWKSVSVKRRTVWICSLVVLWLLASANYYWAYFSQRQLVAFQEKEKLEKPQKDELIAFINEFIKKNLKINKSSMQPLKSKIFVVDNTQERTNIWITELNNKLPENFVAKNKNELKTIVEVKQQSISTKRYTDGSYGFTFIITINIIDVSRETVIYSKEIRGTEPPSSKKGGGSAFGTYPIEDVTNYIKSLQVE